MVEMGKIEGLTKSAHCVAEEVGTLSESIQLLVENLNESFLERWRIMRKVSGSLPGLGTRPRGDVLKCPWKMVWALLMLNMFWNL